MKNSADLGGCYPTRPSVSVDNTLLDLQNSSYPSQPHSIIANCLKRRRQYSELRYMVPKLISPLLTDRLINKLDKNLIRMGIPKVIS